MLVFWYIRVNNTTMEQHPTTPARLEPLNRPQTLAEFLAWKPDVCSAAPVLPDFTISVNGLFA